MMNVNYRNILQTGQTLWFWLVVFILCVGLDLGALFYQHVLHVYPCELCIYTRVWLFAIALVALLAMFVKTWLPARILMSLSALILALGLALETWNLIVVEYSIGNGGSCAFFANFPEWAPLDKWMPAVFEVQDFCQATPKVFWFISMAHVLALVSLSLIIAFSAALIGDVLSIVNKD
ncbi:disulfide bond formation protein B [Agarilytica rhodophyticola]|uniref:disulfide bond formation protein B n=1 Tax=Agarilytica rhodophyticola TaxID=1737490 RepID=UPI001FE6CD68|nr:disulfide bond formation protein B [Agarilytica rhodophyticola]